MIEKRLLGQIDWLVLTITLSLALIGGLSIFSATYLQEPTLYQRQLYWLLLGMAVMAPLVIVDYSVFERFAYPVFALSIVSLIVALIFGKTVGGAQRWLSLGFISFQPSEFAKIAFITALAKYLSAKEVPPSGMNFRELIIPGVFFAVPFLLVFKQPDLGTALIFFFVFATMMFAVKVRTRTLVFIITVFAVAAPFAWRFLKDYQKARLLSFIDPALDPLGSGYHILQSKIAVGSGGFFGKGFRGGTQGSLLFLPAHHTDFIFPTMAEEWGFIGAITVISLFCLLILRGIGIAASSKDRFAFLLALGITSLLFWHMTINAGMVTGLLPVVGVPMPFLSYGGSFLLSMLAGIALLMNISMRRYIF